MDERPPNVPPEPILPLVTDFSPSILVRAKYENAGFPRTVKLNLRVAVKKLSLSGNRRSSAAKIKLGFMWLFNQANGELTLTAKSSILDFSYPISQVPRSLKSEISLKKQKLAIFRIAGSSSPIGLPSGIQDSRIAGLNSLMKPTMKQEISLSHAKVKISPHLSVFHWG